MNIVIRRLIAADADAALAHSRLVGGETDFLTYDSGGYHINGEQLAKRLTEQEQSGDNVTLGAFEGAEMVGMATVGRVGRALRVRHRAQLGLTVRKSHWNRGIGTALTEHCVRWVREMRCSVLQLEVLEHNAAAIHLYEKMGFQQAGRCQRYFRYENGEYAGALYMDLNL